jgi:hypothetical protein
MKDTFSIKGRLDVQVFDENGELKQEVKNHNAVTAAGLAGILDQVLATPSLDKIGWMAVGTGTAGASALGVEIDRNAFTSLTRTDAVITIIADWAAGDATGTLTEAGLFDVVTAASGNMWCSADFAAVSKGAADTLKITWNLTIS